MAYELPFIEEIYDMETGDLEKTLIKGIYVIFEMISYHNSLRNLPFLKIKSIICLHLD